MPIEVTSGFYQVSVTDTETNKTQIAACIVELKDGRACYFLAGDMDLETMLSEADYIQSELKAFASTISGFYNTYYEAATSAYWLVERIAYECQSLEAFTNAANKLIA
jgi:hypothetical protein